MPHHPIAHRGCNPAVPIHFRNKKMNTRDDGIQATNFVMVLEGPNLQPHCALRSPLDTLSSLMKFYSMSLNYRRLNIFGTWNTINMVGKFLMLFEINQCSLISITKA